jgi:hypothetical protein
MTSHFVFSYKNREDQGVLYRDYVDHKPGSVAVAIGKAARAFWKLQDKKARMIFGTMV